MPAPNVYVSISKALPSTLPLASVDVNSRVVSVEVETQLGGFGGLRVGLLSPDAVRPMVYPSLPEPVEVEDMAHIVATIGGHVIHEGLLQRASARRDGFESLGYGVVAGNWSTVDSGGTGTALTDRILTAAIRENQWLSVGEVPTSTARRAWADVQYMTTAQVIDTLCAEGSDGVPWLYHVYEDRVVTVTAKTPPATPTYRIAYDPATMSIERDYSEVADAVRGTYQELGGAQRVTSWLYRTAQTTGVAREGVTPTSAYLRRVTLSPSGAVGAINGFLRTWMDAHSTPLLSGGISLSDWRGLTLPGGVEVPGYAVRAGQWVEIEGYGSAVITRTSCNLTTGSTSIDLDAPSPRSLTGLLARLQQTDNGARSKRDPLSGNRL